jgi:Leucine-rich repeat (LRR) protein
MPYTSLKAATTLPLLPSACAETLAGSLVNLVHLSHLDLSNNPLTADSFSAVESNGMLLGDSIKQLTQLTALRLENCMLKATAIQRLAGCLPCLVRLETLHLRENDISEESAHSLMVAVAGLPLSEGAKIF